MKIESRGGDIEKVIKYNILERKKDKNIQNWKSYPGIGKIIDMARDMITNGNMKNIDKLAKMMQCHESQQSAAVIATFAIIIGNKINTEAINIDEKYRRAIGDIILWNTPVIKDKDGWPTRKKYSFMQLFRDSEHLIKTKMIVHGYLGYKVSKEMEQFFTYGDLKK